mmetsp:Transcript_7862/g.16392  ORF Transcript_7862/g.16392 Transcript_7862/m.16392 type:complete len:297 (+) Transcript_7862:1943-2833(+)
MNGQHANIEGIELELFANHGAHNIGHVGHRIQEPHGQMEFGIQIDKSHGHNGGIDHGPKVLWFTIRDNVEFPQGRRILVFNGIRTTHETVRIIVHVADRNDGSSTTKDAQSSIAGGFEQVGQKERIVGSVHLVGCHGNGAQFVTTGFGNSHFSLGLGFRVHGQPFVRHGQFIFGLTRHVGTGEACTGTGRVNQLGHLELFTIFNNPQGPIVIDTIILVTIKKGSHQGSNVVDTINWLRRLSKGLFHSLRIGQISVGAVTKHQATTRGILDGLKAFHQGFIGLGQIKTNDLLRTAFQ